LKQRSDASPPQVRRLAVPGPTFVGVSAGRFPLWQIDLLPKKLRLALDVVFLNVHDDLHIHPPTPLRALKIEAPGDPEAV
jgi:hypothetical protein